MTFWFSYNRVVLSRFVPHAHSWFIDCFLFVQIIFELFILALYSLQLALEVVKLRLLGTVFSYKISVLKVNSLPLVKLVSNGTHLSSYGLDLLLLCVKQYSLPLVLGLHRDKLL